MPNDRAPSLPSRMARALLPCLTVSTLLAGASAVHAAAEGPALGYSPANMDKRVSPRKDFYRYAAGHWLERAEIPASEPEISGFTELSINLDQQLLKLIKEAAAAKAAPGSPRQQIGDYWLAAMDVEAPRRGRAQAAAGRSRPHGGAVAAGRQRRPGRAVRAAADGLWRVAAGQRRRSPPTPRTAAPTC